jgi:small-conductance mechanosensitive channel
LLTKAERYLTFDQGSSLAILLGGVNRHPLPARMVLGLLAGATISSWLLLSHGDTPSLFPWLFLSLLVIVLLPTVTEALCLAGKIPDHVEQTFHAGQRWRIRLAAVGVGVLIFVLSIPDPVVVPEAVFLICRAITICCACLLAVLAILSVAQYYSFLRTKRKVLRPILLGVAAVILYLEFLGFRELSAYVLASFASSFLLYAGMVLFIDMLKYLYSILYRERQRFFMEIGIVLDQEDESDLLKSIGWLQGFLKGILIVFVVLMLVRIWDVSHAYAGALFSFLLNGFHIGDMLVVPARIVLGILVFIVGLSVALWIKKYLEQKWEPDQSFAASTREALLTVTGYICYVMAALVGLSVTGVSFSGLTVVAGALSVGIGFGMQNIVNNFVSGLILLFERPIKRGDWVVVGSTEGHVKKISVRSTIIQTFDRADVIVPNSELIASPVTNMMFNDARGRLRVSLGVAYGSDTELVRSLLLEIANGHGEVIIDGSSPQPEVFFQAFGESSLNFDLLCHLKNVDNKYRVLSEINFKIDAAFRLHGIEIPFPQRDVHIKRSV